MSAPFANTTKFVRSAALPVAAFVLIGCSDSGLSTEPRLAGPATPTAYAPTVMLRGTVDLVAGTMTFEPLSPLASGFSLPADISASIYGNQGVTVRIYNSAVAIVNPSSPGKKTFSAMVGVRNLLPHPIGDEQSTGAPLDTMGIDIFLTANPVVTSTSGACTPTCTVTAKNADGKKAFSAVNQSYWHWHERVGAAGSGSDTTLTRKSWVFEADAQVTNFSFDVSVSAAWPAPVENRWKVEYTGDSIPYTTAAPRWRRITIGATGTVTVPSAGIMRLTVPRNGAELYTRYDSISPTTDTYIEARVRKIGTGGGNPEISLGIDDDARFIAVGISGSRVGFLSSSFGFLGNVSFPLATTGWHTYQIRKIGTTRVELWVDGALLSSRPYTDFNSTIADFPAGFYFGAPGIGFPPTSPSGIVSEWDYVIYEIGASQP